MAEPRWDGGQWRQSCGKRCWRGRQWTTSGDRVHATRRVTKAQNQLHSYNLATFQEDDLTFTNTGVIRFVQTEWHHHERDRNAWQIERAEMKARIAKLEGDGRTNKRLRESLDKHVRILEHALKVERAKSKAGSQTEDKKEEAERPLKREYDSSYAGVFYLSYVASPPKAHNSFLDLEYDDSPSPKMRHDGERDRSRLYLGKCVEEVQYHTLTIPQQQFSDDQEQPVQPYKFGGDQAPPPHSLEDVYVRQGQKGQPNNVGMLQPSPLPNNHAPIPRVSDIPALSHAPQQAEQASYMTRNLPERQSQSGEPPLTAIDRSTSNRTSYAFPEDQVEKVSHSYDAFGRPIASQEDKDTGIIADEAELADADGWNFDDPQEPPLIDERPAPEYPLPQRPDTDVFPSASNISLKSPIRGAGSHRRKTSLSRRRRSDGSHELRELSTSHTGGGYKSDPGQFKVRYALRGHLDVVRSVIFTGGGSPAQPEICTTGDDGVIKRWTAGSTPGKGDDLDLKSDHTHRGHTGAVLCLAASPAYQPFSNGGRVQGDGWVFSGGQDATVRVWERGRVDPKATLDGHTDAVWTVCVLPGTSASIFGDSANHHGGPDRIILASGGADGTILIWAVSTPPQVSSPQSGSRRGTGGSRRANSVSAGSNFPSSPQPNAATTRPFQYTLIHRIERVDHPSPTCISPLSINGDTFVVSFADASVLIYNTRSGEEIVGMASQETYDGTPATGVNAVAATTVGLDGTLSFDTGRGVAEDESLVHGPTGSSSGVEGMILSGHEDRHIRFFDANSGMFFLPILLHQLPSTFPFPVLSSPQSFITPIPFHPAHSSHHLIDPLI